MPRILIIDDSQELAHALEASLTQKGYDVGWAKTAVEGYRSVLQYPPDLILLDLNLPDIDGLDYFRMHRQKPELRGIPVIICTGSNPTKEDKLKGFELGAQDYVLKPFDFDELEARVAAVLKRGPAPQAAPAPAPSPAPARARKARPDALKVLAEASADRTLQVPAAREAVAERLPITPSRPGAAHALRVADALVAPSSVLARIEPADAPVATALIAAAIALPVAAGQSTAGGAAFALAGWMALASAVQLYLGLSGGRSSFAGVWTLLGWSAAPLALSGALAALLRVLAPDAGTFAAGPALFWPAARGELGGYLLARADVFGLWSAALLLRGLPALGAPRTPRLAALVVVLWTLGLAAGFQLERLAAEMSPP